jgi:hypothetical protein
MGQIAEQVHGKFKVFAGALNADDTIGALAEEISGFVRDSKAAAKSIGVEYLESAERLIIRSRLSATTSVNSNAR